MCQFLLYSKVTQSYIYIYNVTFLLFFSITVYPKRLDIVSCVVQKDLIAYPF